MDLDGKSPQTLKLMGNSAFSNGEYQEAVVYYSLAIKKQPHDSSFYSNRALCYVQLQDYHKALSDCKRSIELDKNNLKAHFFAGQAHLGLEEWDEAIAKLVQAQNMAIDQHKNFGDNLTAAIRLAKRKRFEILEQKRKHDECTFQVYLNNLILQDAERQKAALLGRQVTSPAQCPNNGQPESSSSLQEDPVLVHSTGADGTVQVETSDLPQEIHERLEQIDHQTQRCISDLNDLFNQVDQRRAKREVPEYLCGRISFELMMDPVITPSGITYDRKSIVTHLRKVGHFDPLTRAPLTEDQLIPNLCMKEVIQNFLEENPWAESY